MVGLAPIVGVHRQVEVGAHVPHLVPGAVGQVGGAEILGSDVRFPGLD